MTQVSTPFWIVLVLGLFAGLADFLGGLLLLRLRAARLRDFVALGAGFMLSAALLEMLPESFRLLLSLRRLDSRRLLRRASAGAHVGPALPFWRGDTLPRIPARSSSYSVIFGLAAHTFFDGIAIASGFAFSSVLGWLIFTGMVLHKLPEGFTVGSVMLASGRSARIAVSAACLLGSRHGCRCGRHSFSTDAGGHRPSVIRRRGLVCCRDGSVAGGQSCPRNSLSRALLFRSGGVFAGAFDLVRRVNAKQTQSNHLA